jgi:peptidoglycan/xylan/chitin deacetylase (PgdA/CDA1 family)
LTFHFGQPLNIHSILKLVLNTNLLGFFLCFLILSTLLSYHAFSEKAHAPDNKRNCNCVVFRLDDIPYDAPIYDKSRIGIDLAVMNVFIEKNQPLSLALVMHYIDRDPILLKKIKDEYNKGLFELALHGWNHADYSNLSETQQQDLLGKANKKMQNLFGKPSSIFIPPYTEFNNYTIDAMKKLGINLFSSVVGEDNYTYFLQNQTRMPDSIYHLPQMATFEKWQGPIPIRIPINDILKNVETNVAKYGYAIITLHPQSFVKFKEGLQTDKNATAEFRKVQTGPQVVDEHQINNLKTLLDSIQAKNLRITSFSKLVGAH